jgi:predicted amidophosphoribosyltransferase
MPLGIGMSIAAKSIFQDLCNADGIVPIPLHPEEHDIRGFNQSIELANVLSIRIGVPVIDALRKTRRQSLQGLGFLARMKAVDGLYQIKDNQNFNGKTLIIIDDVFAAGATCSESAKMLKHAYTKSVMVFVAGRTIYSGGKQ